MRYRINHGDGTTSEDYETYTEARRHLERCADPGCPLADEAGAYRIEREDGGGWSDIGAAGRP